MTQATKSVHDRVIQIICERLDIKPETVTLDSRIEMDLGADSLDLTELIMVLEEEFNIDIDDTDLELSMGMTVAQIIQEVEDRL